MAIGHADESFNTGDMVKVDPLVFCQLVVRDSGVGGGDGKESEAGHERDLLFRGVLTINFRPTPFRPAKMVCG